MKIPPTWELPQRIRNRLGEKAGRQRAMYEEEHLLLILHEVPEPNKPERTGALFWRDPQGEWRHTGRGSGLNGLKEHIESYAKAIEKLDQAQDRADEAVEYLQILEAIAPVQRAAAHLHEVLQSARDKVPQARELIGVRDRAYEVSRAAELVYTDTRNGLDCATMRRSEEQAVTAQRMATVAHRLNMLLAVFLPLTALASVFGMNMANGLDALTASPLFFWTLVPGSLVLGMVLGACLSFSVTTKRHTRRRER